MSWNTQQQFGQQQQQQQQQGQQAQPKQDLQANDIPVPNPPTDSISSLSLNGDASTPSTMLIAGSWDKSVSCYELSYDQSGQLSNVAPQQRLSCDGAVLCTDIASDGMTTFVGGTDNKVMMWNPSQGATAQQIGVHDAAVCAVKYSTELGLVMSASWDRTVRVWDTRQPSPVATIPLSDKAHCMDVRGAAMVVGTADRKLNVYDLSQGANFAVINQYDSPLNFQTRCVAIFGDVSGFAVGCIEGRVAIENFAEMGKKSTTQVKSANFVFKCHRDKKQDKSSDIFPVNDISFTHLNTFSSVGSDGVINFWDKDQRHRLRSYERFKGQSPITCSTFSPTGHLFVYAMSYDWSLGVEHNKTTEVSNNIMIHQNTEVEIQPKEAKAAATTGNQFGRR